MTTQPNPALAFEAFKKGAMLAANRQWPESHQHFLEAFRNDPAQIRYSLYLGGAMWEKGLKEQAVEFWSIAVDHDPSIRVLQYNEKADPMTRQVSRVADSQIRLTLSALQDSAIESVNHPGRIASAAWPQTHRAPTQYPENGPRPYTFFAPDLPHTPIFNRENTVWAKELEVHTPSIRDEFLSLARSESLGAPYVNANLQQSGKWDLLKGSDLWTSFHLFRDGKSTAATDQCPLTCAALEVLPLVRHQGNPMEVFFSVLKPGTHIPPHYGLANSRATVHLPLIIPSECGIRVGDQTHHWREGETFLFDDSYDHEAWNKSPDTRVVLIFEAWRPDMTDGEIEAVEASYKARQDWLDARRMPQ